jgi:hypothetical protein
MRFIKEGHALHADRLAHGRWYASTVRLSSRGIADTSGTHNCGWQIIRTYSTPFPLSEAVICEWTPITTGLRWTVTITAWEYGLQTDEWYPRTGRWVLRTGFALMLAHEEGPKFKVSLGIGSEVRTRIRLGTQCCGTPTRHSREIHKGS